MNKSALIVIGICLLVVGVLAPLTGTAYTLTLPKIYASSATLQVIFPEKAKGAYDAAALDRLTKTEGVLVTSKPVLYRVIENLMLSQAWGEEFNEDGAPLPRAVVFTLLSESVSVSYPPDTVGLIRITVFRQDPEESARIANEIPLSYRDVSLEQSAQIQGTTINLVDPAELPSRPVSPDLFLNIAISTAVGSLAMVLGAVLIVVGAMQKKNEVQQGA